MQKKRVAKNKKRIVKTAKTLCLAAMLALFFCTPAFASGSGAAIVDRGFGTVYDILAAIVSAIGSLYLLWGLFEWATALNTQDGGAQAMAFKRIAAGLVATMGPQLIPLITSAIGS